MEGLAIKEDIKAVEMRVAITGARSRTLIALIQEAGPMATPLHL